MLVFGGGELSVRAQADLNAIRARAEQGDPEALNALASAYANGQGVPQDFAEALRLYGRAAERGLAPAFFNLGMMHELGRGVPADLSTAFRHYLKAAELGLAPAQFNVGNMYANGVGVAVDYFEAALWFRQAADTGIPEAQYNLALAYELGRGVARDDTSAQRWYRLAATQGYSRAQYNLALMLEEGRGSAVDLAGAAEFYRASAIQNYAPAQNNLGILHAEGRGVPTNLIEAYTWLALAVENGARPTGRDLVAGQLSSGQLAEANIGVARLRAQLGIRDATVASAVALAPAPARPTVPQPPVAPAVSEALNARLLAVQAELERQRTENSRLSESAQALAREKSALEQRLATAQAVRPAAPPAIDSAALENLRTQVDQLTREAAGLRAEKIAAERAAEELNAQFRAAREIAASGATAAVEPGSTSSLSIQQLAASDSRIARLLTENSRMNDDVKRSTIELSALGRQLRTAQDRISALERGGAPATAEAPDSGQVAALTQQVDDLRATNERITAENQQLRQAGATPAVSPAVQQRAAQAEQALAEVTRQRDALVTEKAALERRMADLPARPATDDGQLRQLREQLAQATTELANARRGAAEMRTQVTTAERAAAEARSERERIAAQVSELQRAGQGRAADTAALEQLRRQLAAVMAERDTLAAGRQAAASDRDTLEKLNAQLDGAGRTIAELHARNENLVKDLEVAKQSAEAALAAQAAAARSAPSEGMRLELQTLQNQVRAVETQMEEDRRNAAREISALASQLQSAREANRALGETNRSLLQARGADDATVRADMAQLDARLQAAQADLNQNRAEQARLTSDLEARTRELEATRSAARVPERERDGLRAQIEEMAGRLAAAERQLPQFRQLAEAAKVEAERARAEQAALTARYADAESAAQQHGATVAELTGLNEKLSMERAALEGKLNQLSHASELTGSELSDLRIRAANSDRITREHVATINALGEANQKLQGQLNELSARVTEVQAENERLAGSDQARQVAEQRAENLTAATAQLAAAQRELMAARSEVARLSDTVQVIERDRNTRISQLQADNAAINARLRQAQGTLDQIASAARLINSGGIPASAPPPAGSSLASVPTIPVNAEPAPVRTHVVGEGDSLTRISVRYYGTSNRWQEIYDANRDLLRGENSLRPGQRLRIP